ncbi:putative inorganic phosphate cotransporter isoform X6 [Cherax quadricarinatus]
MSGEAVHDRRRTNEVLKKMSEEEEVLVDTVAVTLPPGCCGARHILAFMGFLGFANVYAMRVNLSVAIVAMVNNTAIPHANKTEVDVCPTHSGNSTKPSEGVTFPAMNALMAKWVPPLERSKMSSLVYAGSQFGTVVSLPISGLLCQSSFLKGWPAVFYLFGVLGLLWFFAWMFLIHNSPESHPRICLDEKIYIQTSLNQTPDNTKVQVIPWRHILTSLPFWAIFIVHIAQNWGFYTLLTELPTYMKNILHFNIAQDSFVSALPYLLMWLFSIIAGQVADYLRTRGTLSTTATRRIFNSIGIYGPMVCIVLAGYAGCNRDAAIGLLCGAVGLNGAVYSGYMNSHLDIAPNFAGTLMGITNTAATIPGFVAPQVVGYLIKGKETVRQWKLVFWIAGIVYFVGNTFYIIFISGEQQHWNDLEKSNGYSRKTEAVHTGQYGSFNPQDASSASGQTSSAGPASPTNFPEIF